MGYGEVIIPYVISIMTEEHTGCWGTREEASHTALGVLDKSHVKREGGEGREEGKEEREREGRRKDGS